MLQFLSVWEPQLLAQIQPSELGEGLFSEFSWIKVAEATGAILLVYVLMQLIERGSDRLAATVPKRLRLLVQQSVPMIEAFLIFSVVGFVLNLFVQLSANNILALTGTAAVALGFAFKDYISSIIAGIVALFETPYRMGDRVQIGDYFGEVIRYGIRAIKLRTLNDDVVTIPHNTIWTEPIANANDGALEAQINVNFYVAHSADMQLVKRIIYHAAYSSRFTQLQLPIRVQIFEKPWGTQCRLKAYPLDARYQGAYISDITELVKTAFKAHSIGYPEVRFATDDASLDV